MRDTRTRADRVGIAEGLNIRCAPVRANARLGHGASETKEVVSGQKHHGNDREGGGWSGFEHLV
jgi:hypothetical protein